MSDHPKEEVKPLAEIIPGDMVPLCWEDNLDLSDTIISAMACLASAVVAEDSTNPCLLVSQGIEYKVPRNFMF